MIGRHLQTSERYPPLSVLNISVLQPLFPRAEDSVCRPLSYSDAVAKVIEFSIIVVAKQFLG